VLKVSYAQQEIQNLLNQFSRWRTLGIALAIGVLVGAVALIINTIQLAIFARRREVAVMKLVGATNWFIRVPFMLEGFLHGIIGAVIGFALTYSLRNWIASFLPDQTILGTNQLFVTPHEAIYTGLVLLLVGAVVGVLGSAFAVRRYLAV
jgi:cell division transport system permease protein